MNDFTMEDKSVRSKNIFSLINNKFLLFPYGCFKRLSDPFLKDFISFLTRKEAKNPALRTQNKYNKKIL